MTPVDRYNTGARALHWLMAALILVALGLGLLHDMLKPMNVMPLHKSLGLCVLVLGPVRILWRLTHAAPAPLASMSVIQRKAMAALHGMLYLLMVGLPVSGWIVASAGKYPLSLFGLVSWPKLTVAKDSPLADMAHEGHELAGWLLLVLLAGHIGAALWHHVRLRDETLQRML